MCTYDYLFLLTLQKKEYNNLVKDRKVTFPFIEDSYICPEKGVHLVSLIYTFAQKYAHTLYKPIQTHNNTFTFLSRFSTIRYHRHSTNTSAL